MIVQKNFSEKVNRVLLFILLLFCGLGFRCFQLAVIQHEDYIEISKRPKRRTTIEQATRGLICDRNGLPLAVNAFTYKVGISYDAIRKLPRSKYRFENGKIQKIPFRSTYIKKLCAYLGKELDLDPYDLEDVIHGKASLFPNQTFYLKEEIPSSLYYKLRSYEKDWPGLKVEIKNKRHYPNQQLASHILGYMGLIHQSEYDKVKHEISALKICLESAEKGTPSPLPIGYDNLQEVKDRYLQLKDKSYQLSSLVGKAGVEGRFDESLRGVFGKRKVEVDIMGRELRVLPDSTKPKEGDTLWLSIDKNLQEAAEILLTKHEEKRDKQFRMAGKNHHLVQNPWIKGGAMVAMDPKNGQILALASYPRFNPNDFLQTDFQSKNAVVKWLEIPAYFEKLWEGELPLEKELFDPLLKRFYTTQKKLNYELYVETVLSSLSKVKKQLLPSPQIRTALNLLESIESIQKLLEECPPVLFIDFLYADKQHILVNAKTIDQETKNFFLDLFLEKQPQIEAIKEKINPFFQLIPHNLDKLLLLDILRIFIPEEFFHKPLPADLLKLPIADWFEMNQHCIQLEKALKEQIKNWFHIYTFRTWREEHFKTFLKEKRKLEKEEKKPQKPYLDYLEEEERSQFSLFYQSTKATFLQALIFDDLPPHLLCYRNKLQEFKSKWISQHEKSPFNLYQKIMQQTIESNCHELLHAHKPFEELKAPLYGIYRLKNSKKNPQLKDLAKHFYPATGFGYSRSYAYQEAAPQGSIFKVVTAYEALKQQILKNPYSAQDPNPLILTDNSDGKITDEQGQILGYTQDGKKISRFYKGGKLPRSSKRCGKISLKEALETSSNLYFSILAADHLKSPLDLTRAAKLFGYGTKTGIDLPGEITGIVPYDVLSNRSGLYALSIGQHSLVVSPLQTAKMFSATVNGGCLLKPQILHSRIKTVENRTTIKDSFEPYHEILGIKSTLFEESNKKNSFELRQIQPKTVIKKLFFPIEIQSVLHEGLKKVVNGERGTARAQSILFESRDQKERYLASSNQMIGKTASAEIVYHPFLDHDANSVLCKHIWFASAGFQQSQQKKLQEKDPEIVIIVYLRFGNYGKEAALLASELYQEYQKLKNR
jgi:cell division protein FtsI/penicillin-binding protein 2